MKWLVHLLIKTSNFLTNNGSDACVYLCTKIAKNFLRVIFSENRESEDTHEKSIFLLFRQNIPFSELIQGKIV